LWQEKESNARKRALWAWGWVLGQQEKFEDAKTKFDCAQKMVKGDAKAVYLYGYSLTDLGQYQDAIVQFDKASALDQDDPLPRHSKAGLLFQLGRYEEGWKEWWAARQCYERLLDGELRGAAHSRNAIILAGVLGEIFEAYEDSDKLYKQVLERQDGNANASVGRATLNQQWANSDAKKPAEIHARLSYLVRRSSELLKRQLGKGIDFQTYLALADLYIEFCDWTEAREQLDLADSLCGGSTLKRGRVTERRGLVCYHMGQHAEAVEKFRQALLVRPDSLDLRSNLGNALLRLKQFETAQNEFARVLKDGPGNIDALCGAAQVHIELAEDGDPDQYEIAVQYLTDALEHGRYKESGSKRLQNRDLANIYYARGYARTKSYEANASRTTSIKSLEPAFNDFQKCKELDPIHCKARAAIEKINKRRRQRRGELLVDVWGPIIIFCLSVVVLVIAQLVFILTERLQSSAYVSLSFASLLFMVAAVCLPQLLKLKLPGMELEKASVSQVAAPSIGISRSESLIGRLKSLPT
jgi:tetratricopeptide (TPR) repeat protein